MKVLHHISLKLIIFVLSLTLFAYQSVSYANNAPEFRDGDSKTIYVLKDSAAGKNVGYDPITATDADNDTLTYSLSGTDAASFTIDSSNGRIKTGANVDYTRDSFSVTVTVSDGNGGTDSIAITIEVNQKPTFDAGETATRSVAADAPKGTLLGDAFTATDPDDDTLTYAIMPTGFSFAEYLMVLARFEVDQHTGQLKTFSNNLRLSSGFSLDIEIFVTDEKTGQDFIDVTISVTNAESTANNAPVFTDGDTTTRSVAENTASSTNFGNPISATDADNDTLTYTLSGTDAGSFTINRNTGQLQTRASLDYETKTSYEVTVWVSDGNGDTDSIDVTINITDIVDETPNTAPVLNNGKTGMRRTVRENVAIGTKVGKPIPATDADDDTLTYSITHDADVVVSIDPSTGQLTTTAALDYETTRVYRTTVTVTDGNGGSDTIRVFIRVRNDTADDNGNGAPSNSILNTVLEQEKLQTLDRQTLRTYLRDLQLHSDGSSKYMQAIAMIEEILVATRPEKTQLFANYPNPLNPETWIPYQLAKPSQVRISIYNSQGRVVRHLDLGHQLDGYYTSRNRAAYWDGRNHNGERIASGIYFYQLQTDNTSLLRKMVILK